MSKLKKLNEFPEIKIIKERRKSLGLTQFQLAKLAGVSQSLVTKIEKGRQKSASYAAVRSILNALKTKELESIKNQLKLRDIMNTEVISARENDSVGRIENIMIANGFSQVPVLKNGECIGRIDDNILLDLKDKPDYKKLKVKQVMKECFPLFNPDDAVNTIKEALKTYEAILVRKPHTNKITGIITKQDYKTKK